MIAEQTDLEICKCGNEILDDGYNYDYCISCHANQINCEINVIEENLIGAGEKKK